MVPTVEFRMLSVDQAEPVDRTTAGTVIGTGDTLDLGAVDTTDEAQDSPVRVIWWRVTDMQGNVEVTGLRVWISDTTGMVGTDSWYMDVTDTWTSGKTAVQVKTGAPGIAPLTEPSTNMTCIGGGSITGTSHGDTSQYIYITSNIGVNETTETKSGLKLSVGFDFH